MQQRHNKLETTFKEFEAHYQESRQTLRDAQEELETLRNIKEKYDVCFFDSFSHRKKIMQAEKEKAEMLEQHTEELDQLRERYNSIKSKE